MRSRSWAMAVAWIWIAVGACDLVDLTRLALERTERQLLEMAAHRAARR